MIRLMKSTFIEEHSTKKALCDFIMNADKLSIGEQCDLFEKNFSAWQKREYTVFFNSGSSANLALIQALINQGRIKAGARVGFSAVTWATNVMPIIQMGCNPVAIDVELGTLNISSKKLLKCLKTTTIDCLFLTHLLGFCDDVEEIKAICEENNILLLEDNCESMGTIYKGKKLGNYGLASTFSTYVGHHLSTVEGGLVCTDDEELAIMLKMVRAHGWDRNLTPKDRTSVRKKYDMFDEFFGQYTFYVLGFNLRPTEINGFGGNKQLPLLDKTLKIRFDNFKEFSQIYSKSDHFFPLCVDGIDFISNFALPLVCRTKDLFRKYIDSMVEARIEVRPIVGGSIVKHPFFKNCHIGRNDLSNADIIHEQGFYFGNNAELTKEERQHIIRTLCI